MGYFLQSGLKILRLLGTCEGQDACLVSSTFVGDTKEDT